jgi:CelD/BcsL family acetyltransferase involved in cellulose biosynthesis
MTKSEMRDFLATVARPRGIKIQTHITGTIADSTTIQVQTKRPAKRMTYRGMHKEVRTFKIGMDYPCHMDHQLSPQHLNVPAKAEKVQTSSRMPIPSDAESTWRAAKTKRDARNAKRRARYAANKGMNQ